MTELRHEHELQPLLKAAALARSTFYYQAKVLRELLIALDKGWPGFQV